MTTLANADESLATLVGLNSVVMQGKDLDIRVSGRCTDSTVTRSIAQASTLELVFEDSDRVIARSGIFGNAVTVQVGPYTYSCTSMNKSGATLTIELEDEVITRLQDVTKPRKVEAGKMTHVEFVSSLVREFKWLKFRTVDNPNLYKVEKSLTPLYRGHPAGQHKLKPEGTWSAINRIGKARGWRTFVRGVDELWYVPDSYLFKGVPTFQVSEDQGWVHDIDYDINIRKRAATLTITADAAEYAIPAGTTVFITDPGPTHGKWLVRDIQRQPISNPTVTVTLTHPQPILPEPKPASTSGSGGFDFGPANATSTLPVSPDRAVAVAQYAMAAGFTGPALLTAVMVSFAENTSHDPALFSPPNTDGSIDRGLWQINDKAHPNYSDADMRDGLLNAEAAYAISNHGTDWTPWTTFKSGAYAMYLVQAQRAIHAAEKYNSANGATVGSGSGGTAPGITNSRRAADFMNEILSQKGKPYIFAADDTYTNSNPSSFDCSGLIVWGAGRVGITFLPHNAEQQYELCLHRGTTISVDRARYIRGALLFAAGDDPQGTYGIGHVAVSMGNGADTFQAKGTGYGTNEFADMAQFTRAALIPDMIY